MIYVLVIHFTLSSFVSPFCVYDLTGMCACIRARETASRSLCCEAGGRRSGDKSPLVVAFCSWGRGKGESRVFFGMELWVKTEWSDITPPVQLSLIIFLCSVTKPHSLLLPTFLLLSQKATTTHTHGLSIQDDLCSCVLLFLVQLLFCFLHSFPFSLSFLLSPFLSCFRLRSLHLTSVFTASSHHGLKTCRSSWL